MILVQMLIDVGLVKTLRDFAQFAANLKGFWSKSLKNLIKILKEFKKILKVFWLNPKEFW